MADDYLPRKGRRMPTMHQDGCGVRSPAVNNQSSRGSRGDVGGVKVDVESCEQTSNNLLQHETLHLHKQLSFNRTNIYQIKNVIFFRAMTFVLRFTASNFFSH